MRADQSLQREIALEALRGVGNASLGQWEEWSGYAYHVKRRLTREEQKGVGNAIDVRGTEEAKRRQATVRCYLPDAWKDRIE